MRCIEYLPPISRSAALKSSFSARDGLVEQADCAEREGVAIPRRAPRRRRRPRCCRRRRRHERVLLPAAARRGYEGLRRGVDYLGLGFAGDYLHVDAAFFFYLGEHLGTVFRVAHGARRAGAVGAHAEGLHQVLERLHRLAEPRAALRAYRAAREGVLAETHGDAQEGDLAALFVRTSSMLLIRNLTALLPMSIAAMVFMFFITVRSLPPPLFCRIRGARAASGIFRFRRSPRNTGSRRRRPCRAP